jgi:putative membrane protein insertion efficiency factor
LQQNQSFFQLFFLKIRLFVQWICLGIIRGYKYFISPFLPPSCRFTPTCSCYAAEAIEKHGPLKGVFLALGRIFRCHPFCHGGYDPVPPVKKAASKEKNQKDKNHQCRVQNGSVTL